MVTLKELKDNMSSKIIIPKEFDDFYEWTTKQIEKHGEYFISGCFEWRSDNYDAIKHWFNFDCTERFGVFGAGLTGNLYAFWIDDEGEQKIVHLGLEGDNLLVLGNNFIEFLQYLSIGYDDTCIDDFNATFEEIKQRDNVDFKKVSKEDLDDYYSHTESLKTDEGIKKIFGDLNEADLKTIKEIYKNIEIPDTQKMHSQLQNQIPAIENNQEKVEKMLMELRQWISTTFKVKIPNKGNEIVNLTDKSFENWVNRITGYNKERS